VHTHVWIYLGAAYLALITTPCVIWLARRIGAVDYPSIRSVHTQPIPRIGGVAIYFSSVFVIVSMLFLSNTLGQTFRSVQLQVTTLLCSATGIFLIGLIDDLRGLPARWKFAVELLGAGGLCLAGVRIGSIGVEEGRVIGLGWLSYPITLLWIVGITNAVNMSDGLDGLAAGVTAIACGVIATFAIYGDMTHTGEAQNNDAMMAIFALALLGSLSGFLFFNFNPAKVFMGDCGSLFIGFTIAAASVMCVSKSAALIGLALPALALGIPIFDTLFSMLRRFLERRSLFAPDRSHFHHRLLDSGLDQRWAVATIYLATAAAAGLGLFMMISHGIGPLIIFGVALCLIVLLFHVVGAFGLHDTMVRLQSKYSDSRHERDDKRIFENLQLQFRQIRDLAQWWKAICEAARQMDFAWVSLKTTHEDGRVEEELWQSPNSPPDLRTMVTVNVPIRSATPGPRINLEFATARNGSLETTGRRVTLFARLLDENAANPVKSVS
jgi:UDP-GlcNAc:undecaprenyl-phosphate GlcNAc-1-phosphate transferase